MTWDTKDRIRAGDRVDVVFVDGGMKEAVVIWAPAGAGDLWQVKLEDGTVWALNPYASDFSRLSKAASGESE